MRLPSGFRALVTRPPGPLAVPGLVALLLLLSVRPASAQAVRGMVFDEATSQPVPGAEVRLLTAEYVVVGAARTDAVGRFVIAVDSAGTWVVSASAPGYVASPPADVAVAGAGDDSLVLALRPVAGVEVREGGAPGQEGVGGTDAYVFGRVLDREGEDPVEGAEITLASGPDTVRTLSRWNGRFRVPVLRPGAVTVRVQHLAYAPEVRRVDMEAGKAYEVDVTLRSEAIELPGIEVTVRSRSMARFLEPFYHRMDLGMGGNYLDRDELREAGAQPVGYVLNRLPSVSARRGLGGFWQIGARGTSGSCRDAAVFVDRVLYHRPGEATGGTDALELSTTQVEGVEFYPGPATLPPEFNLPGVTCAVIIWTRRGG